MLGPNKWRLLTIVAGILLAQAIDSPSRTTKVLTTSQTSDSEIGIKIQKTQPWSNLRVVRNLVHPQQIFSNIDNVRFIGRRSNNEGISKNVFGSFRYPRDYVLINNRRSDEFTTIQPITNKTNDSVDLIELNQNMNSKLQTNLNFIPLLNFDEPDTTTEISTQETEKLPEGITAIPLIQTTENPELFSARRTGIQFNPQSHKYYNPFTPQNYQEDNISFGDTIGALQRPYSEDFPLSGPEYERFSRGIQFEQSGQQVQFPGQVQQVQQTKQQQQILPQSRQKQIFRDDVTKFGDVNGPVTAVQRPYNDFSEKPLTRGGYDTGYYNGDDFRSPRSYFPPKAYVEYSDYPGPPRAKLPFWKTNRSPRVVFPQDSAATAFPSGASSTYNSDNVVFR